MIKKWDLLDSRVDKDYNIFRIRVDHARSPRNHLSHDFYTLESSSWVNVVPVTPDNEVVMIRQYRHGSRRVTLEIPGGLVEESDPGEAAARELAEETGYEGDRFVYLGVVNPNPAIFNNQCYTYLIPNARKTRPLNLDQKEDIEVELMPVHRIPDLLESGEIDHALVVVAFHFYFAKYPLRNP